MIVTNRFMRDFEMCLIDKNYSNIIFLCIGTDKVIGDCFGPIVGSLLNNKIKTYKLPNIKIVGSLENTINYNKMNYILNTIMINKEDSLVISIDAALANKDSIGKIIVDNKGINLGESLEKKSTQIGDISIKGIVGENMKNSKKNFTILQNISLNQIMKLSKMTADGIIGVVYKNIKNGKNIYIKE